VCKIVQHLIHVELIVLAKVNPNVIENKIKAVVPFLSNVMVIGDKRKYLTCLLTLKVKMCFTSKRLVVLYCANYSAS